MRFIATALAGLAAATAIWAAGSGTALAPEPSRTTTYLGTGSAIAHWINTGTATTAYYLSGSNWTASSIPVGSPCSTVANVGTNYSLIHVVVGQGAYRRCSG